MKHEAKRIHAKDLNDGSITMLYRCCGDTTTDQWHTLYLRADTTEKEIQDFLANAKASCERMHAARDRARAIIEKG